jgi:ABC-type multidrug transport system fused ATPase/permease subunit
VLLLFLARLELSKETFEPVLLAENFGQIYMTMSSLNNEVSKIAESILNLDDLYTNLLAVVNSVQNLRRRRVSSLPTRQIYPFENGNIIFEKVVFAYPERPQHVILKNFSFTFQQGKSYGIAGKNGIGKSTITKNTLKLYDVQEGQILIGKNNIQNIDAKSLHQRTCYQTNRPAFFHMSIAENVFYPEKYQPEDLPKLVEAAKQVGI